MPKITIRQPSCFDCDKHFVYQDRYPKRQYGITMRKGERFCLAEKKARCFKSKDAKTRVPVWCPKKIFPRIVRVYGFKDFLNEMLCIKLSEEMGSYIPTAHNYRLRTSGTTDLSASEYYEAGIFQDSLTPLPRELVEIDDGVSSAFFFRDGDSLKYLPFFNKTKISEGADSE